jgi:tetratricopeptide (TPR) repeat protein
MDLNRSKTGGKTLDGDAGDQSLIEDKDQNGTSDPNYSSQPQVAVETEPEPNDPEIWNRRATTFLRAGDYNRAYECFQKTLAINPNHQRAWLGIGTILLDLEENEREALACIDRAIELDSNIAEAWFLKGIALARQDRLQDALISYEHATELDSGHAGAWYGMGLAARYLGYKKRAEECFKKSKKLRPE